ncbi:MAG: hypothetical protein N3E44_00490 [Candidatus Bathyarchaeota archaeon]|nr:hypothetical protein [Candidatus Bathyarchaeota archaeon]
MPRNRIVLFISVVFIIQLLLSINSIVYASDGRKNLEYVVRVFAVNAIEGSPIPYLRLKIEFSTLTVDDLTNGSGYMEYRLTVNRSIAPPSLRSLIVYGDYIVTSIQKFRIENIRHTAIRTGGETRYTGLSVDPEILSEYNNRTVYRFILTLAKAKLVNVSCADPFSNYNNPVKLDLIVEPSAIPVNVSAGYPKYENVYFVPLDYPVRLTILRMMGRVTYRGYTTTVKVGEDDSLVNWMKIYTFDSLNDWITRTLDKVEWYSKIGLDLYDEGREAESIRSYLAYLDTLFDKRLYREAMFTVSILQSKLLDLNGKLSNQDRIVVLGVFLALAFSYGFSTLILNLTVKRERIRFPFHIALFFIFAGIFFYTLPELRAGFIMFTSTLLGVKISYIEPISSAIACFSAGTIAFIFFYLSALIVSSRVELPINLAIRNLQSRIKRTLLVVLSIAIVVGACVSFIRVIGVHGVMETGRELFEATPYNRFIALYTDIYEKRFITQDIIVWLNTQKWIANISYCMATIDFSFERAASAEAEIIYRDTSWSMMKVYSIYPEVFAKLYKLDTYVLGGYLVSNETAALIPSTLGIPIGEIVQVNLILWTEGGDIHIPVGRVKVKGLFNPGALSEVKRPDGRPMFENPDHVVIVTVNSLPMTVAGINVFDIPWLFIIPTDEGIDLASKAEEIVHLFGCDVRVPVDGYLVSYEEVHMYRVIGLSGVVVPIAIICMMVYLTMYSTIYERSRDLRVLAVLGGTPRSITNMLLTEGLILGLFSSFIGYFGTYLLYLLLDRISMLVPSIWGVISLESIPWGTHTILLSLLIGTVIPLLSVYISTKRAKTLALVSRESRRSVERDLRIIGERGEFPLPIRTTMFEGDLLYAYFDELFSTRLKSTKASGQLFQDGTFEFRFPILSENQLVIDCRLIGVRRDETIYPIVEFSAEFRGSKALHEFLYRLEKLSLGYTVWKESKLKIKIVRTAPTKKEKTPEDILAEVKLIQDEIKLVKSKLEKLESMRPKVSSAIYEEYHGKYTTQIEELMRKLRPLALELEPYYDILLDEVKRISLELEKLDVARKLGELSEEEYIEKASPLEEQLKSINVKIMELDNLFKELRLPRGMRTLTGKRSGET